jgi:hypothetical protein
MKSSSAIQRIKLLHAVGLFFVSFIFFEVQGQKNLLSIPILVTYNGEQVQLGKTYLSESSGDSIRFDKIKFYISNPQIKNGSRILKSKTKYHQLIDLASSSDHSLHIKYRGKEIPEQLIFSLGVDSISNVTGAHADDLDPSNGMYWAWQSGYVFFKLEGYSPKSKSRNHQFIYHIGGFQDPNKAIQSIRLNIKGRSKIVLDLSQIASEFDVVMSDNIMSPSKDAVRLSNIIAKSISVQ